MNDALHPLLAQRSSPLAFDARHVLDADQVDALLEAARWAPSAGNSQPWGFFLGVRGTPEWERLVPHLAPSSARWAVSASLLVVNLAHVTVDDSEMPYSEFSEYDVGQAVAHMTVQAQAMGLACRQFRAFDLDGLAREIGLRPGWRILTMTAVGVAAAAVDGRERRSLDQLLAEPFPD